MPSVTSAESATISTMTTISMKRSKTERSRSMLNAPPLRNGGGRAPARPHGESLAEDDGAIDHRLRARDFLRELVVHRLRRGDEGVLVGLVHPDPRLLHDDEQLFVVPRRFLVDPGL